MAVVVLYKWWEILILNIKEALNSSTFGDAKGLCFRPNICENICVCMWNRWEIIGMKLRDVLIIFIFLIRHWHDNYVAVRVKKYFTASIIKY